MIEKPENPPAFPHSEIGYHCDTYKDLVKKQNAFYAKLAQDAKIKKEQKMCARIGVVMMVFVFLAMAMLGYVNGQ